MKSSPILRFWAPVLLIFLITSRGFGAERLLSASGTEKSFSEDLLAFSRELIVFEPFCFTGDRFPSCAFEHPERVAQQIGPYSLNTTFYDEAGTIVTVPGKSPGRYAQGHRTMRC